MTEKLTHYSFLELATKYAQAGYRVFPVRESGPHTKAPYPPTGHKSATTDLTQLAHWARLWPSALVGLPMGANGLVSIDLDRGPDPNRFAGQEHWRDFLASQPGKDPATLEVQTQSGGLHLLYAYKGQDISPCASWNFFDQATSKATHVDLRAKESYIVALGSFLPSGKGYVPADPEIELLGPFSSILEHIRPLPDWLRERMVKKTAVKEPVSYQTKKDDSYKAIGQDRGFLREIEDLKSQPAGSRNDGLNRTAFTVGGMVGAGRVTEAEAMEALSQACRQNGLAQDEPAKTASTLRRSFSDGLKAPLPAEERPMTSGPTPTSQARAGEGGKKEPLVFESLASMMDDLDTELGTERPAIKTGLEGLDKALGGGIQAGLTIIGASPACGKSALCLQVADHIADDTPVLFYALEMTALELYQRSVKRAVFLASSELKGVLKDREKARLWTSALRLALAGKWTEAVRVYPSLGSEEVANPIARSRLAYKEGPAKNLFIRDISTTPTIEIIQEEVSDFMAQTGRVPVVFVDYLQLLHTADGQADKNDYGRTNAVAIGLKRLSAHCPVVAVSSFSRGFYYTEAGLESFKDSGGIEYTANCALVLGHRSVLDTDAFKALGYNRAVLAERETPRRLEVRCVKARGYEPASAELAFYAPAFCFLDTEKVPYSPLTMSEKLAQFKAWEKENKKP